MWLTIAAAHVDGSATASEPALAVPKDAVTTPNELIGRLIDARGRPLVNARITGIDRRRYAAKEPPQSHSDADGRFGLAFVGAYKFGQIATVFVDTEAGWHYEINFLVTKGVVDVRVPTLVDFAARGPADVAAGELAGVVVEENGTPIADVDVGHRMKTDEHGIFRIPNLGDGSKVKAQFRKPGYSPETFVHQPTGVSGWIVVLGRNTYLEGIVHDEDGHPAAGALVRAHQGPRFAMGWTDWIVTETRTDGAGKYRLYVQPDEFEVRVRTSEQGVALVPDQAVGYGAHALDIKLAAGVAFHATVADANSGQPVPNVRLICEDHPGIEGCSTAEGLLLIRAMPPGKFLFKVAASGYARWWSEDCGIELHRRHMDLHAMEVDNVRWQRNFNSLDFNLHPGMEAVKILVEKGVRIRGRVIDPDDNPVSGATVAAVLAGTGGTISGDDRFDVATNDDGSFEMLLPASNEAQYNLMAHDGTYDRWRTWANGVLPPISTKPGQEIEGVLLRLTRPATIRGRVVDKDGQPVANAEVRGKAADKLENLIYDPVTRSTKEGAFELKFLRPTDQLIEAGPSFQEAKQLRLAEGQIVHDLELVSVPTETRSGVFITIKEGVIPQRILKKAPGAGK